MATNWHRKKAWTRGGDGRGGPYDWASMTATPDCGSTIQRQAIGAICYDAGISVGREYGPEGSGTPTPYASNALTATFRYRNAIAGINIQNDQEANIGSALTSMINPNLDAKKPVILGITGKEGGHAAVCDGYGFKDSVAYYHLNMAEPGWAPQCATLWYQLIAPDITDTCMWSDPNCQCQYQMKWSYDTVLACVYNIFPDETGEIISGRVLDRQGKPVTGIKVTAQSTADPADTHDAKTDPNGIFALVGCHSATQYQVKVNSPDVNYPKATVQTKISKDRELDVGNVWNVELRDLTPLYVPDDCPTIQGAVDAAGNGQLIIVRPGTYTGVGNRDIDFKGKAITVMSENGPETCILDCQGSKDLPHRAFYFDGGETSASVVEGLTIVNGYCVWGGAIACYNGSDPTIRNCIFQNNSAIYYGGAVYNSKSNPTIIACSFRDNSAGDLQGKTGRGGALHNLGSSPKIISSVFTSNTAGDAGGAVCNDFTSVCTPCHDRTVCIRWDPVYRWICIQETIIRCPPCVERCYPPHPIWGQKQICIWDCPQDCSDIGSRPTLRNCTLIGNTSTNGAAIDLAATSCATTLENCILWDNSPLSAISGSTVAVSYSDVQGGLAGDGNINADPLFVNPTGGDYRLRANSPCLDAGDPKTVVDLLETDLDGNPRVVNGRIDMGAYEHQGQ
jgi:hypothetical protein